MVSFYSELLQDLRTQPLKDSTDLSILNDSKCIEGPSLCYWSPKWGDVSCLDSSVEEIHTRHICIDFLQLRMRPLNLIWDNYLPFNTPFPPTKIKTRFTIYIFRPCTSRRRKYFRCLKFGQPQMHCRSSSPTSFCATFQFAALTARGVIRLLHTMPFFLAKKTDFGVLHTA